MSPAFAGGPVKVGTTKVGVLSGGSGTSPYVITWNANADPAAIQQVIRQIAYSNISDAPDTTSRIIQFVLTDPDGNVSDSATQTINLIAADDAPTGRRHCMSPLATRAPSPPGLAISPLRCMAWKVASQTLRKQSTWLHSPWATAMAALITEPS